MYLTDENEVLESADEIREWIRPYGPYGSKKTNFDGDLPWPSTSSYEFELCFTDPFIVFSLRLSAQQQ